VKLFFCEKYEDLSYREIASILGCPVGTVMSRLAAVVHQMPQTDPLLTVEDVAQRLNVTKDWVWDHS
jgi:hypothetical protein